MIDYLFSILQKYGGNERLFVDGLRT